MFAFAIILGVSFLAATFTSGFLTWVVRDYALSNNWATPPRSGRHIHTKPIPRFGGVAIYATLITIGLAALTVARISGAEPVRPHYRLIAGIFIPATMFFFVGLYDDIRPLSARIKLFLQVISSFCLYLSGIKAFEASIPFAGYDLGAVCSLIVTTLWVIGVSNAINIIDGMDGLATGSAIFATLTICALSLLAGHELIALASIILCGALIGFLRFNLNPASIFLGDCGSLLVGFLLGSFVLAGRKLAVPNAVAIAAPILALGLPITETFLSIARRILRGVGVFSPDRRHIHHRLLDLGYNQRQAVVILYGFCGICALASVSLSYHDPVVPGFFMVILAVTIIVGVNRLGYVEFGEISRIARRTMEQRQVVVNNVEFRFAADYIRHASSLQEIATSLETAIASVDLAAFELTITSIDPITVAGSPLPIFEYHWSNPSHKGERPLWGLSLMFGAKKTKFLGKLIVRGSTGVGNMMFDANVLLDELQPALTQGLAHVVESSKATGSLNKRLADGVVEVSSAVGSNSLPN